MTDSHSHPLEKAALALLKRQKLTPAPQISPLFQLLNQWLETNPPEVTDRLEAEQSADRLNADPRGALAELEEYLTPQELLSGTPQEAAAQILEVLLPANQPE